MSQWHWKGVGSAPPWRYSGATMVLLWHYKGAATHFQCRAITAMATLWRYNGATLAMHWRYSNETSFTIAAPLCPLQHCCNTNVAPSTIVALLQRHCSAIVAPNIAIAVMPLHCKCVVWYNLRLPGSLGFVAVGNWKFEILQFFNCIAIAAPL